MADWKFYGRRGQLADRSFGNDPIRDDTLGLSLAPIDAVLFEARLNDATEPRLDDSTEPRLDDAIEALLNDAIFC